MKSSCIKLLSLLNLTFIFSCFQCLHSFNIDTTSPIIISNIFDRPRNFFGATVALVKPGPYRIKASSWVIIGAPKANSTKHQEIDEPGGLWRCSLGKVNGDSCEVLEMDSRGNELQHHHAPGETVMNRKDGSWLGGSLSIGSNRLISCASRWSNQRANSISMTSHYLMNGICYWRPTEQITADFLPELPPNNTLIPLRSWYRQGFNGSKGFDWSFGQAGFSVHANDQIETIIGAPGIHHWKGSVIRLRDGTLPRLRRNGFPEDFGKFYQAPQLVAKSQLHTLWKQNATYFGYAVTSGKFIESNNTRPQYVSGAPRGGFESNLTGHVLIFNFPKDEDKPLIVLSKLEGPVETATYFGSVLCSVDLNNDGWDDLLVGAPLFGSRRLARLTDVPGDDSPGNSAPTEFAGHGDEGAVFVYMSERTRLAKKGFVVGNNEAWSRFGSSIASIGDINKDGFNDVVIGAPYEDSRRGSIYIYHGSPNGLIRKFAQVIHAKELDSRLAGFGFSLSPAVDLDENSYNDIAVGAYTSAQVVILRSKPVVKIIGNLAANVKKLPINRKGFSFEVYSCVSFESKDSIARIGINVKLHSDINAKATRVYFKDGSLSPTNYITYNEQATYGDKNCRTFTALVQQVLTLSGHPVLFRQEVTIIDKSRKGKTEYKILPPGFGQTVPRTERAGPAFNSFCKNCAVTALNVTTDVLSLDPSAPCGDDDLCIADLTVDAYFQNFTKGESFVIGTESKLHLEVKVSNNGETAIYPKVIVSWLRRGLINTPPDCGQSGSANTFILSCSLGQTLEKGQTKTLDLEFDMSDLVAGEQNALNELVVNIDVKTTSDLLKPVHVQPLMLSIVADPRISILGAVKSMNITTINPYNVFTQSFLIKLEGPSPVKNTELQFDIPQSLNSELVANVLQIEAKHDGKAILCNGPPSLPSLFKTEDPRFDGLPDNTPQKGHSRLRRDSNEEAVVKVKPGVLVNKKTLFLHCDSEHLDCVQVVCLVYGFFPGTRISVDITYRMSTTQMMGLMDKHNVEKIEFRTKARVTMLNVDGKVEPKEAVTRLGNPIGTRNAVIWVASSVTAGLLILIFIALILCCLGVFDRKKREEPEEVPPEAVPLQNISNSKTNGEVPEAGR